MIPRAETLKLFVRNQACRLGAMISRARKQQGISQADFARQLHVTIPTLRKLEFGDASVSLDTFLAALLLLKIEGEVLNTSLSDQKPLPTLAREKQAGFVKQLKQKGFSADDAAHSAQLLELPAQQRLQLLIRQQHYSLDLVIALMQSIGRQHGRAMPIGDAAMFMYGRARIFSDYRLWVRIANDELVEIVTAHGLEIESNRAGRLVAYDEGHRFEFLLLKRVYNHDHELLEYDAVEARAVNFEQGRLMIPCVEEMIKLKKTLEVINPKDLEDIAYLESMVSSQI